MSEHDRLQDKLAKLGRDEGLARPDARTRGAFLSGVLVAIDETVLPRDLTLTGCGKSVTLRVSKRRLLAVAGAVTAVLEDPDTKSLGALGDKIFTVFSGCVDITLQQKRPASQPDTSELGASVAALAEAWDIDLYAKAPSIEAFLASVVDPAAHVVWRGGDEIGHSGDAEVVKRIRSLVAGRGDALRSLAGDGPRGFALARAHEGDRAMLFLWDGQAEAALAVPRDNLAQMLAAWG